MHIKYRCTTIIRMILCDSKLSLVGIRNNRNWIFCLTINTITYYLLNLLTIMSNIGKYFIEEKVLLHKMNQLII